ncbi:Cytosine/adenosine deaminase [Maridesulfovibrio ferrireducens]|uniref:Cytosine/adenosine deaminase n=1 Tax=Maridesulfovibrio ferrireducens TaxID=246191 RepID=A0A1G9C1D7_9BACT|nr:amidohydrolase family protein [Maridesulfovibrio ferrireducens]SDK45511.1 Cytosine/adenosine deaminase [Maridesulfovibrio ferrireducens]
MKSGESLIHDFALIHNGTEILETGTWSSIKNHFSGDVTDLGDVTIVPGLINAHVHLELSHLEGKTVQGQGFLSWITSLLKNPTYKIETDAINKALSGMLESGTVFCADISTCNCSKMSELMNESGIGFYSFCEAIGQKIPKSGASFFPDKVYPRGKTAGAGHAPHSTCGELLIAVKKADSAAKRPFSIHLAENEEEDEIVGQGTGPFAEMLRKAGILSDCGSKGLSPVEYIHSLGILDESTLAIHCVKVSESDIKILADTGTNVCLCPRSNEFIGEGRAPWEKIINSGINTCLGTDSIASNHDLNMWNELEYLLKEIHIKLTSQQALSMITKNGAKSLMIEDLYGSLEVGKRPVFATVPSHLKNLLFQ